MSCCGRSNNPNRIIRSQKTNKQKITKPSKGPTARHITKAVEPSDNVIRTTPTVVPRLKPIRGSRCTDCNSPTIHVNIAGREREQCSNPNCRKIKR